MNSNSFASAGFPYAPAPPAVAPPVYGSLPATTAYYPSNVYQSRYGQPWSSSTSQTSLHTSWLHVLGAAAFVFALSFLAGSYPPAKPLTILVLVGAFAVYLIANGGAQTFNSFTTQYL